jgi:hypothetical protein
MSDQGHHGCLIHEFPYLETMKIELAALFVKLATGAVEIQEPDGECFIRGTAQASQSHSLFHFAYVPIKDGDPMCQQKIESRFQLKCLKFILAVISGCILSFSDIILSINA